MVTASQSTHNLLNPVIRIVASKMDVKTRKIQCCFLAMTSVSAKAALSTSRPMQGIVPVVTSVQKASLQSMYLFKGNYDTQWSISVFCMCMLYVTHKINVHNTSYKHVLFKTVGTISLYIVQSLKCAQQWEFIILILCASVTVTPSNLNIILLGVGVYSNSSKLK